MYRYISAYTSSDKGERKDGSERNRTERYVEKLQEKKRDAVLDKRAGNGNRDSVGKVGGMSKERRPTEGKKKRGSDGKRESGG